MKRLKYLFMALIMVTCMVGSSKTVSASSYETGKAMIPYYNVNSGTFCTYSLSNITNSPIDITVTLFNSDGTVFTDDGNASTGKLIGYSLMNYNDQNIDSSITFTLNPHSTGIFKIDINNTTNFGYGIVEWKQAGNASHGLIASGLYTIKNGTSYETSTIEINGGLPF